MDIKTAIFAASAIVLLGAGCASGKPSVYGGDRRAGAGASGSVNPCDLVTKGEAAALLEMPAMDGERTTRDAFPYGDTCLYAVEPADPTRIAGATRMVQVEVTADRSGFVAADFYRNAKEGFATVGSAKEIPGLGEDAYFDGTGVRVLKGGRILYVRVGAIGENKYDKTVEAANLAIPRMP